MPLFHASQTVTIASGNPADTATPVIANIAPYDAQNPPTAAIPSNVDRKGIQIDNNTSASIYWGYSNQVSPTNFAFRTFPDDYYEMNPIYTGAIFAVSSSGTVAPQITELS